MKQIIVSGRVQGVSYRYFAKNKADSLEILGWVKNLEDGRVEILAEGKNINKFLDWCKKGPWFAKVTKCEVKEIKTKESHEDFRIVY